MPIVRLTEPTWLPVTLDEAREQLLLGDGADPQRDAKVKRALDSAIGFAEKQTGRLLARATYEWRLEDWPGRRIIEVLACPIVSVEEVSYYDISGVLQIIDPENYTVEIRHDRALIVFKSTYSAPSLYTDRITPIGVVFVGGYDDPNAASGSGDDPALRLPDEYRHAILMKMEADLEVGVIDPNHIAAMNAAVENLLGPLAVIR